MTTYRNKTEATKKANELNNEKGYNLYSPYFFGEMMVNIKGIPCKGWYLINKETKKCY